MTTVPVTTVPVMTVRVRAPVPGCPLPARQNGGVEHAEVALLLTPEAQRLLADSGGPTDDPVRRSARLRRAGYDPRLIAAVLTQARLRTRARAKFGEFADRMLFTEAGLEQATRLSVAAMHAGRLRDAGVRRVADLGCGIGGDAMAAAALDLDVVAIDVDEPTAAIAAVNLSPFPNAQVRHADVRDVELAALRADGAWIDPGRRVGARRLTRPSDFSPPLDWALEVAATHPTGIKLSPAMDRALIPSELGEGPVEAQWVSDRGEVVELVLWSGRAARAGVGRAALVLTADGAHELVAPADAEDAPLRRLGEYVYEPDGAVIRARLIGALASAYDLGMVADRIAYLTGDSVIASPFIAGFRVREVLPLQEAKLRQALRARGIGTLEIKKRGVDLDPAALRSRLGLKGDDSATLIVTRLGDRRVGILSDRLGADVPGRSERKDSAQ